MITNTVTYPNPDTPAGRFLAAAIEVWSAMQTATHYDLLPVLAGKPEGQRSKIIRHRWDEQAFADLHRKALEFSYSLPHGSQIMKLIDDVNQAVRAFVSAAVSRDDAESEMFAAGEAISRLMPHASACITADGKRDQTKRARVPGSAARKKAEKVRKAWELHKKKRTGAQIAVELDCSEQAVSGYLKEPDPTA